MIIKEEENKNIIIIKYKINKNEKKIKIFNIDFVNNNKDKCKIIYNNNEYELTEYFNINNNDNILEIKLTNINNITNAYAMFYECSSLISLPDISKWNTINVTNMDGMFDGCSSLKNKPNFKLFN